MVQMRTWLTVADNSGARQLMCILPLGGAAGLNLWLSYTIWISGKHPLLAIPNGALTCVFLWFLALTWHRKSQ